MIKFNSGAPVSVCNLCKVMIESVTEDTPIIQYCELCLPKVREAIDKQEAPND